MRAGFLVVALAGTSCFAEAPSAEPDECAIGSKGCACTQGGACDAPLECHAQSQACYDPDCDEGSLNCPCFEGMCFADLMCDQGLCQSPMQSSGSDSAGQSTTAMSAGTGSSGGSENGVADTGAVETGDVPDEPGCVACFASHLGESCPDQFEACAGQDCMAVRDCVLEQTSTFAMCCADIVDGQPYWNPLAECLATGTCADACAGVEPSCP